MDRQTWHDNVGLEEARSILIQATSAVSAQRIPLSGCFGRVLAEDVVAQGHVPPFDRSPLDGYAFRAADSAGASKETPVTLRILEEIAAGDVAHETVTPGTAVKILTGAPIPPGADAMQRFEDTEFDEDQVTLLHPSEPGENIVRMGEDVRAGDLLVRAGTRLDHAACGTLASQGIAQPLVYRRPLVGILSTGNELLEPGTPLEDGKIYNSNRYTLEGACIRAGAEVRFLGIARDDAGDIAARMAEGLSDCDMIVATGGASVGDYDLTPQAMEQAGAQLLIRKVVFKPGGACAYGVKDGKPVCCLSGNPASSITNFHAVAMVALRRLCGCREVLPQPIRVVLAEDYPKKSPQMRLLRGALDLADGVARMHLTGEQGNTVLSSLIGCDVMAVVSAGTGVLRKGDTLDAFLI